MAEEGIRDRLAGRVLWTAALAGIVLTGLRVAALWTDFSGKSAVMIGNLMLQGLWQDLLLVAVLSYLVLAILRSTGSRAGMRFVAGLFEAVVVVIVLWGAANLSALRMLGAPVTVDWLAYSDVAHTDVIFDSLPHVVAPSRMIGGLILPVLVLVLARFFASRDRSGAGVFVALFGGMAIIGLALSSAPVTADRARLQNPVIAFVGSLAQEPAALRYMPLDTVSFPGTDFDQVAGLTRPADPARPIRNVLLYAYESTPARQTQGWEGSYPVTPNLAGALSQAVAFDRAYAHVPASNYFLVSAFLGIIPELSSVSMTVDGQANDLPSLPRVLKAAGMRTAWFNSADNRFQNTEGFVTETGFEHVVDYRDWTCSEGVFEVESVTDRFRNTSSDLCTLDQMTAWIDADDQPFFLAFRTGMTHYPYFPGTSPQAYVEDEAYNRYLNALRVGDETFGALLAHLTARDLLEETLIVVMGDHGEAFGEHGTYVHAAGIFEENVHVPMALINPQLFSGTRSDLVVSISDMAPTITDLLGLQTPSEWEGHSVFAETRPAGVLFFAPWNGFQIGFRDGMRKFITNANTGAEQLFDLEQDPLERTNLAESDPEALEAARQALTTAVVAHQDHLESLLSPEAPFDPAPRPSEIILRVSGTAFGEAPQGWVMLDGADIGGFTVNQAPDSTHVTPDRQAIEAAFTDIRFAVDLAPCAKTVDIYFLNDKWAGEGLTGDIDLILRSVHVGNKTYGAGRFTPLKDRVGGRDGDDFRFYRRGGISIGLDLPNACLREALVKQSP